MNKQERNYPTRMHEVPGVQAEEQFQFEGRTWTVDAHGIASIVQNPNGYEVVGPSVVCEMVNHPERIIRKPRQEAAKKWEWVVENFNESAIYSCPDERQKLIESKPLLRNPIPDPITGLVPCGCGGVAISEDYFGDDDVESSYRAFVSCEKCELRTPDYPRLFDAKEAWNTAMGYTPPGANSPESDRTAPNGDKGAEQ